MFGANRLEPSGSDLGLLGVMPKKVEKIWDFWENYFHFKARKGDRNFEEDFKFKGLSVMNTLA